VAAAFQCGPEYHWQIRFSGAIASTHSDRNHASWRAIPAVAAKPGPSIYTNYVLHDARVAVVQNESLLLAGASANGNRELTLFGRLGANYELQYSTNLGLNSWYPLLNYTQTNGLMSLDLDSTNPAIFYRLLQH